ncbi:hypothetical protein EV421DRAFT_1914740 [Armillaria borealis]|uniref:F-box domain-containing protein n=1 Tax=Armillaria borealis TaxID=47425 RepID=A0AA39IEW6_9AGAR|nr:hypothetical protein EV421DRAFT_1914740 [Armillaria borealis]
MPEFPPEIYLAIFSFLDARSLASCQQVCQSFLALINEMVALEYTNELARHGYIDHAADLPLLYRLDQLHEHHNAWDKLDGVWSEIILDRSGPSTQMYSGNVLAKNSGQGRFDFTRLPSSSPCVEQREWLIPVPDSNLGVSEFEIDASQNLLVVYKCPWWERNPNIPVQFHLLTMSSGKAHELASAPILKHVHNDPNFSVSFTIQIAGDHLGVRFNANVAPTELVYLTGNEIRSFAFLTEKHVVIAVSTDTELRLLVVNFIAESSEQTRVTNVTHCLALRLPNLSPSSVLLDFIIECDPSPTWPNQDDSIPFHDEVLYSVTLCTVAGKYRITILIPRRTLLAQLRSFVTGAKEVEWSAWGPEGARVLFFRMLDSIAWATFGSRFVAFHYHLGEIDVYDFNQMTLKRKLSSGCPLQYGNPNKLLRPPVGQDDPTLLVVDETVLPSDALIFQEEVRTSLPFCARAFPTYLRGTQDPYPFGLMCSQDNITIISSKYHVFTLGDSGHAQPKG